MISSDMMKTLQAKLNQTQEKLKLLRAEGSSGGDIVRITVDGTMEAVSVFIDPIAVDPRDIKMLEELVQAAFIAAVRKMQKQVQKEMVHAADGVNLPFDLMSKK